MSCHHDPEVSLGILPYNLLLWFCSKYNLTHQMFFSWSNQRSGTDSETEGEDGSGVSGGPLTQDNGLSLASGPPRDLAAPRFPGERSQAGITGGVPSPQLTLAEFLQK